jgi:hypothetical protein
MTHGDAVMFTLMPPALEDLHEWISFEDPDEERTWVFDMTFLTSSWTCIYGQGCQGVLTGPAPELVHGCCSYGAHFIDDDDLKEVEEAAARLTSADWQYKKKAANGGFLKVQKDGTRITRVVNGACIFLNRVDHPNGPGCALHQKAVSLGQRPLDWKPDVCWQLPLRQHDHVDEHGYVTSTVREWKRRDWGEGGQEFHWWCTESPDAFVGHKPVYAEMSNEIIELVGSKVYALLVDEIGRRSGRTMLPHPALKVR